MKKIDVLIIGGGPAGLSAGIRLKELGIHDILVVEQNQVLGGILNQCIHHGFGLHLFKEELTGPEYAHRLIHQARELEVPVLLGATVTQMDGEKRVRIQSLAGVVEYEAGAIVLCMGSRERPRGAINIPGARVAGVFSAGSAQELVNLRGHQVGKRAVIVGSGDIGLIMARRLTLEGCEVVTVVEKMPYSSGLRRNIVQCLDDFNIPLELSHTVSRIFGEERVTGVNIAQVDEAGQVMLETEQFVECDTVLFSVGLIPEATLAIDAGIQMDTTTNGAIVDSNLETSQAGIFACGNVLHIHDLVDNVTLEAYEVAVAVKDYLAGKSSKKYIDVGFDPSIRYVVPHFVNGASEVQDTQFKFRATQIFEDSRVVIYFDDEKVYQKRFRIITPAELEMVILKADVMEKVKDASKVTVKIEPIVKEETA